MIRRASQSARVEIPARAVGRLAVSGQRGYRHKQAQRKAEDWRFSSPSSAVIQEFLLIINRLRKKSVIFLHCILHKFGAFGHFQSEMSEQSGDIFIGFGEGSQPQLDDALWAFDSWGVSTRLVGGLIMTHSDDDGLVLPPLTSSSSPSRPRKKPASRPSITASI